MKTIDLATLATVHGGMIDRPAIKLPSPPGPKEDGASPWPVNPKSDPKSQPTKPPLPPGLL